MLLRLFQNGSFVHMVIILIAFILAMLIAISFHEYLHARVAYRNGDPTAKIMGRMTINPLAHIDPVGILMLLIMGFGWAKPVPVNSYNFKNGKRSHIEVALAGIFGNLVLGIIFSLLYALCATFIPAFETTTSLILTFLNMFLYYGMAINFVLAFFNLLPIYPMDGFRVVETLTKPDNAFVTFMRKYSLLVLIALIVMSGIEIYLSNTAYLLLNKILAFWQWLFGLLGA